MFIPWLLGCGLRSDLQPAIRAFLYIWIVPFRVSAIVPIRGWLLCRRWRKVLLLDMHRRRPRRDNHRRVAVIGGRIIRPREPLPAVTIAAVIPAVTQAKSRSAIAVAITIARIEAAYPIKS